MCAGKCSFFVSELQLVNVYSDRKFVTPLSNYMGLESVEHGGDLFGGRAPDTFPNMQGKRCQGS